MLNDDGDRVECHACGRYFAALGRHAHLAHDLLPDEYRAIFGLNIGQGLVGSSYRAILEKEGERLRPYWPVASDRLIERRWSGLGQRMRLQARRNPENRERWREAGLKGAARVRALRAANQWETTGGFRDSASAAEASARAQQRLRELRADPAWINAWRESVRKANGGEGPIDVACKVCGTAIQATRRDLRRGVGRLCGDACRAESRRRANLERWRGDPVYVQVVQHLSSLSPEVFGRLGERDASLVRLFYGVGAGPAVLLNELAERSGLSAARVGELIRVAVATLLGPGLVSGSVDSCVICGTPIMRRGRRPRATCGKACDVERRRRLAVERHARGPWSRPQLTELDPQR